jgi:hypothetical protein
MVERSPGHFMACHFPLDEPVSGMPAGSAPAEAPRVEPVEPVDPVDAPVDPVDAPVTAAEE